MRMDSQMRQIAANDRLIVALDVSNEGAAMSLVTKLKSSVTYFKVGLELFMAGGFNIINSIGNAGGQVFLDLKMLDIPETIRKTLHVIATQHQAVAFATIHVLNKGLEEFLENPEIPERLKILVVTVVTGMDEKDWAETGAVKGVDETVSFLTERALSLGCDGVIASGQEAKALRLKHGEDFLIASPGIRPDWCHIPNDDQKRVVTPSEAIKNGVDYLIIGRPICTAPDPLEAARAIYEEIANAQAEIESISSDDSENDPKRKAFG